MPKKQTKPNQIIYIYIYIYIYNEDLALNNLQYLTRSHKMWPSRSCWNGITSALQPEEITSMGARVSCVYYQ